MKFVETGKRVLDFGCSCGSFLARLEQYGYECEGYEPSKIAPANKTCVSPVYTDVNQIEGKFDCVTLFDVFEHFENPEQMTSYLHSLLIPGGHIIIISPNPDYQNDLENFYHLKPGEHAYLWSKSALVEFMKRYNFSYKYDDFSEGWMRRNARDRMGIRGTNALLTTVFVAV